MKYIIALLLLALPTLASFTSQVNELIQLETIIKSNHLENFSEKDQTEVYRVFRVFYENKMETLKSTKITTSDDKFLINLASNCIKNCSCQILFDLTDSELLRKKTKAKILKLVTKSVTEISAKDYSSCYDKKIQDGSKLPIIKEFNAFKAD